MGRRIKCPILIFCAIFLVSCNVKPGMTTISERDAEIEKASSTPFGKYSELVTYTLGNMTGANNSNMPEGDTYEDNAYTRYLRSVLNVQNEDTFEVSDDEDYDNVISMAITTNNIPDIMVVSNIEQLQALVDKGMIEDLTQSYANCASDRIKEIYNSYGKEIFSNVTFDGKLMAIPETNIENGPSLLWLRKDWMDALELDEPETLQDAEEIIKEFVDNQMGGEDTVGLLTDVNLTGESGYSYEYQTDIIFASENAFPKKWIRDKDGSIIYGSITPETKNALAHLQKIYKDKILDNDFLLRTTVNIIDLLISGKSGAFFGPWWTPNNPLVDCKKADPKADWRPYLIKTNAKGETLYAAENPSYKYVVVRKGFEHPELAIKIISALFDYARFQDKDAKEIQMYYKLNVDPTARPIAINVDYSDALIKCYKSIVGALEDESKVNTLETLEGSYYTACKQYLDDPSHSSTEDWSAYASRITACSLLESENIKKIPTMFFGKTDTMQSKWSKLQEMERTFFLQVVTGEKSIDEFDSFVEQWKKQGGLKIMNEVNEQVVGNQ